MINQKYCHEIRPREDFRTPRFQKIIVNTLIFLPLNTQTTEDTIHA